MHHHSTDPARFNQWWHELPRAQRVALTALRPGQVMPREVIPSLVRWRGSAVEPQWWDERDDVHLGIPLPADVHELIHAQDRVDD